MIPSTETIPPQKFIFRGEAQPSWGDITTDYKKLTFIDDPESTDSPLFWNERIFVNVTGTSTRPSISEYNTTVQRPIPEILEREIDGIFDSADIDTFEYGYKSEFAKSLERVIREYGNLAIGAIQQCITLECVEKDVIIETLHTLGRIQHVSTHYPRLVALLSNLLSPSARIRCGAALGLAYLDDPKAIVYIRLAMEHEISQSARICLQRVLEQLETTRHNS